MEAAEAEALLLEDLRRMALKRLNGDECMSDDCIPSGLLHAVFA